MGFPRGSNAQQERVLLDFWNNYLPASLHQRIVSDYLKLLVLLCLGSPSQNVKSDVSEPILAYLKWNQYQLPCLYNLSPLAYFYKLPMQSLHLLLGYIERMHASLLFSHVAVAQ